MPQARGPAVPRRRLGAELRRLREARGLTLDQVGDELECSTSKVSRLENGQGVPKLRDVRDLIRFFDVDDELGETLLRWVRDGRRQGWWQEYTGEVPTDLDTYISLESEASRVQNFVGPFVPGLLQTREYAQAIIADLNPDRTAEEIARLADIRMRRQEVLTRDDPLQYAVVVEEAALRLVVGRSHEILRGQLAHLLTWAERPNVTLQVLPYGAGAHVAQGGRFAVFRFADAADRDVVNVETLAGDRFLEQETQLLRFLRLFDDLAFKALSPARSAELVAELHATSPAP